MAELSDEILTAYVDGELSTAEAREVERQLTGDPEARGRLARLERSSRLARQAFEEAADREAPARLLRAIAIAQSPPARRSTGPIARPQAWLERLTRRRSPALAWGLAMAAMLFVGFGVGRQFALEAPRPVALGPVAADSGLHTALETVASGEVVALERVDFIAVATYEDLDSRLCREFDLSGRGNGADLFVAVACRDQAAGRWSVEFSMEEHAVPNIDETLFAPASGRMHEAVDEFVNSRLKDGPFPVDVEAELIRSGWLRD